MNEKKEKQQQHSVLKKIHTSTTRKRIFRQETKENYTTKLCQRFQSIFAFGSAYDQLESHTSKEILHIHRVLFSVNTDVNG